ncbi:hypothetical protein WAI453_002084 [Rhynchosporium graminicola]|uniref:Related to muscle-derived protein (Neurite-outgrowth-promoting) n=2 Tax=Rhynchosporium TaxID=38037 RepID=A0A1E1MEK7_RHYSE|nr:related to muscle-derived protein (neurite-outgrowth-promoting) [Rhynchosporium commune]CZT47526.1 related to muscle-derived protein (neurite-outgrowth-promoting) [Rhynchosporium secalis]
MSTAASSRAPSIPANHASTDPPYTNGHHHHHHDAVSGAAKKGGKKKATDPNEASNLIALKISQLESDAAGDKEQEAEIERELKKYNRELNNLTSKSEDLQKIEVLHKRVSDLFTSMKRLDRDNQKNKKRGDQLQKEKDLARTESSKNLNMKEKLEKLCRELQKDNNRLKSENKIMSDAEKDNHAAWDEKFKLVLWQLQEYQEAKDYPKSQTINIEVEELFKQRFKSLIDQYELRELHFHSLLRSKELEVQYNMAKYDREKKLAESEGSRSRSLNSQVLTFSKTETELRSQLNIYVEKFKQVEDTLNNSNDLFLTFRKEMEEMSKKTKRLEKDNMTLTRKHDLTNQNILKMAEERSRTNMEMDALRKKNEKLTSIINQMQKQGRGVAEGMATMAEGSTEGDSVEGDLENTESEYDYEDEEGEDGDGEDGEEDEGSEDDYDEETEEEQFVAQKKFGPPLPPTLNATTNGAVAANGIKH